VVTEGVKFRKENLRAGTCKGALGILGITGHGTRTFQRDGRKTG